MNVDDPTGHAVETLLDGPHLAEALESDRFKQFLDHVPFAIAVSQLLEREYIVYANPEFERLTATAGAAVGRQPWSALPAAKSLIDARLLSDAIVAEEDFLGAFAMPHGERETQVDVWSNLIQSDAGTPAYRLVAIAETRKREDDETEDLVRLVQEKDTQLRELQHRVTNNLQMITALIRLEARNLPKGETGERFDRLAGRIHSLGVLYRSLSESGSSESVDLGSYLSSVASAVMNAHAVEGIRLNLKVDTWPVSVNVAMPTGLVVN
ncbi:MAG: histidine kinase, partial [Rhizobiales bacterium 32-66-8]